MAQVASISVAGPLAPSCYDCQPVERPASVGALAFVTPQNRQILDVQLVPLLPPICLYVTMAIFLYLLEFQVVGTQLEMMDHSTMQTMTLDCSVAGERTIMCLVMPVCLFRFS